MKGFEIVRGALLGMVSSAACAPDFDDTPWRIDETRVLAIASEPPEAEPGQVVALSALIVRPDGTQGGTPAWSVCTQPRTSAERTAVSADCLRGEALNSISSTTMVPADGCARFGPNVPPVEGDEDPRRPADPDESGGYFVPVRVEVGDADGFGSIRIGCDLPGVTRAIFEEFQERYIPNENPTITGVQLLDGREEMLGTGVVPQVASGASAEFEVTLPAGAAEAFVRYDEPTGTLQDEREWLQVQWFVTAGVLERTREIVTPSGDVEVSASVVWTAPAGAMPVFGWVVVTDARGGSVWLEFSVSVG